MARQKKQVKPLPTIWEVSDELWKIICEILDELDPPAATGRPPHRATPGLNGIIYRMRAAFSGTSCRGNSATTRRFIERCNDGSPKELSSVFGPC